MTVEQLINELKQFDPKLPIVLKGYEGGVYDGPNTLSVVVVAVNANNPDEWWYGPHEIVWDDEMPAQYPNHKGLVQVLYLR